MAIKNGTAGPDILVGTAVADTLNGLGGSRCIEWVGGE
jgi:hypothetical protein